MLRFLLKRILMMVPLALGITLITFTVIHLAPGEPVEMQIAMNPKVSIEARQRMREFYGLDKPLYVQYGQWLSRLVRLDFGQSFAPDHRNVVDKIKERIPVTLSLNVIALILEFGFAVPIGILAATRRDTPLDKAITVFVFTGFAVPTFWLALLLMYLFGVKLSWLPISGLHSMGYDALNSLTWQSMWYLLENLVMLEQKSWSWLWDLTKHLILPISVATFSSLAGLSRYMRSSMIEVISQDYITTARAKGLPERVVIFKHALRNALLPVITLLGFSVPGLIGGSVIFETIYAIPGMGQLFYMGVMSRDYPLVMGILVIGACLTLVGNLLADIGYALADPRIRQGRGLEM
jgi:peptide/nickel transport system permease protein